MATIPKESVANVVAGISAAALGREQGQNNSNSNNNGGGERRGQRHQQPLRPTNKKCDCLVILVALSCVCFMLWALPHNPFSYSFYFQCYHSKSECQVLTAMATFLILGMGSSGIKTIHTWTPHWALAYWYTTVATCSFLVLFWVRAHYMSFVFLRNYCKFGLCSSNPDNSTIIRYVLRDGIPLYASVGVKITLAWYFTRRIMRHNAHSVSYTAIATEEEEEPQQEMTRVSMDDTIV